MNCLFVCGSKWWPQVSSATTVQDKKASPSASKYANNFKGLAFLFIFFIDLFYFIIIFFFFNSEAMRYSSGTQLAICEFTVDVTNTLLNAWKFVHWLLAVMCWSLQIVVSALSSISGLTAVTGKASDTNHGALLFCFGSCALFAQQPAVCLLNVEL